MSAIQRMPRPLFYTITILLTVACAIMLGVGASGLWAELRRSEYMQNRELKTESLLQQMHDLRVGDKLPDHIFEDLGRNPVRLTEVIDGRSVITFILPDCPACSEQIEELQGVVKSRSDIRHFVFLSSSNPRLLEDEWNEIGGNLTVLYDHKSVYQSMFGVFSFPFNIVINEKGVIEQLISGNMLSEEFAEIIRTNQGSE